MPGPTNDDKKEFLADICSFANSSGGDLVYGLAEENGVPVEVGGFEATDTDTIVLRLEALIGDCIRLRIQGLASKPN